MQDLFALRDQRSGDLLLNGFYPSSSRMKSFLEVSAPLARSAGLAPLCLLIAFVEGLLLPSTGSEAGRGGRTSTWRLRPCGNERQPLGCMEGVGLGMGGLAGWRRGGKLRGGQGANETPNGEGLNAANTSLGSSPSCIQTGASGVIMQQSSSNGVAFDQLSPRRVALLQQREREGACEDGVGWDGWKNSELTRGSDRFVSMEHISPLRDIHAGKPAAATTTRIK